MQNELLRVKQKAKLALRSQKQKDKAFAKNMIKNLENDSVPLARAAASDYPDGDGGVVAREADPRLSELLRTAAAASPPVDSPLCAVTSAVPDDLQSDSAAASGDDGDDDVSTPALLLAIGLGLVGIAAIAVAAHRRRRRLS